MNERRTYGDAVARSFDLTDTKPLITRSLKSSQLAISRLRIGPRQFGLSPRIPAEDTFILALYLTAVPDHELLSKGRPYLRQGYTAGSIRIVNLANEFSARISSAHESLVFYIPRLALDDFTAGEDFGKVTTLACQPGLLDPTLVRLGETLLPAYQRPTEVSQLFVDYVAMATFTHLVTRYGGARPAAVIKGGLPPRQLSRAEAFLAGHFAEDVSLGDVAAHCGLSRAHFARAFRTSSGLSPHRWLLRYRVDRAKAMMQNGPAAIGKIAIACGFADQSHLTRVFTRLTGTTPAAWRQEHRTRGTMC